MRQRTVLGASTDLGFDRLTRTPGSGPAVGGEDATARGRLLSQLYLLAGGAIAAGYVLMPSSGRPWTFELVGLSAAAAIGIGVVRHRPRPMTAWLLFVVAQALFTAGDFCYYVFDLPFPSFGDAFYIAYYPVQAAGLLLLIRSRSPGKDRASLLDALILTLALGLLAWTYLIWPYTEDAGASTAAGLVSIAYPCMDLLLLAVAARLFIGRGARPRSFHLLAASIGALVLTDVTYGAIELGGSYTVGSWLDIGWMSSYVLWGAAALDPSMRQLSARAPDTAASLSRHRLVLLAGATLIAPVAILANSIWPIGGFSVPMTAAVSVVLFGLVLARMVGLVSNLRTAVARHQRAERRETVLRLAATALTAGPDRDLIRRAALDSARALVEGAGDIEIAVEISDGLATADAVRLDSPDAVAVSLATQSAIYGRLVVSSAAPVPGDVLDGLRTLAAQVALALEGAALTDYLSRQRSETRVGALVRNSTDVIIVLDAGLNIQYVTPSVSHVLGHDPDALIGTPLPSLVDPSQQTSLTRFYLANRFREGARAEWRIRRGDGEFTDVEAVSTDLLENPSVNGIVVTARDITERKQLELGLKRQVGELEELDRIRTDFVATVSHELRTPLTSIIGEVELLHEGERGDLTDCQSHGVGVIERNSQRLLTLINDLLTLNHIETSVLNLHRTPTAVASLVDSVLSQVEAAANAKSVTVTLNCDPGTGTVVVDSEQLDRALLNLLTNAVKFTPAGGDVALEAWREDGDLVFRVSDTGLGIPEDEQDRLFTRFFRSSIATHLAIQGTGLGLVIVKRIVEEHGGTISVHSVPDVGTTVTVRIPADDDTPEARVGAA